MAMEMVFDRRKLQYLRELRGMSRDAAAKAAGLKTEVYAAFEAGTETPSAWWQERMASALSCRREDFAKRWREAAADG